MQLQGITTDRLFESQLDPLLWHQDAGSKIIGLPLDRFFGVLLAAEDCRVAGERHCGCIGQLAVQNPVAGFMRKSEIQPPFGLLVKQALICAYQAVFDICGPQYSIEVVSLPEINKPDSQIKVSFDDVFESNDQRMSNHFYNVETRIGATETFHERSALYIIDKGYIFDHCHLSVAFVV